MTEGSVTNWIRLLQAGDVRAAQPLWDRYFERLVRKCHNKLSSRHLRAIDGEDVALSVLDAFIHGALAEKYPGLHDRDELWRLLVVISARRLSNALIRERRHKRGSGRVVNESVLAGKAVDDGWTLDLVIGDEPTPEMVCCVTDLLDKLEKAVPEKQLLALVKLKLECFSNDEIAAQLRCSLPTVERKLRLIRSILNELSLAARLP